MLNGSLIRWENNCISKPQMHIHTPQNMPFKQKADQVNTDLLYHQASHLQYRVCIVKDPSGPAQRPT